MSKRQNSAPKMLPIVLQAIADLRENRGSTAKNIIDRVQYVLEKPKPTLKPKNVVMQVKRAIKHAVDVGIVQQRSGRYKIAIPRSPRGPHKKITPKPVKKPSDSTKNKPKKQVDKPAPAKRNKRRYSSYSSGATDTSYTDTYASSYTDATSYTSYGEDDKPKKQRKTSYKKSKSEKLPKDKAALPKNADFDERDNEEASNAADLDGKKNNNIDYENMGQYILEDQVGNECDNPDCLCNLKSDHMEEANYEDDMRCNEYLN